MISIESLPRSTGYRVSATTQPDSSHEFRVLIVLTGDDVIVHPGVKNEEAKELFPEFRTVKPYLRFTPLPKEQTSAAV